MERWEGKTAIVTGASKGIGAVTALALADAGMVVIAAARTKSLLQELEEKVKGSGRIIPFQCDVVKEDDVAALIEFAKDQTGGVDVLINNAALMQTGTVTDCNGLGLSLKELEESVSLNIMSVVMVTRFAVKNMVERNVAGHVININSVFGHKMINMGVIQSIGLYAPTKFAITAMSEVFRLECNYTGVPIRVTSISPGATDTELVLKVPFLPAEAPRLNPEDIAGAIIFALSTPQHVNITELTIQSTGEVV